MSGLEFKIVSKAVQANPSHQQQKIQGPYCPFSEAEKQFYLGPEEHPSDAIYLKGIQYHFGYETPIHYAKALACFKAAADKGHARAQYYLGFMMEYGEGLLKDAKGAETHYKRCLPAILKQAKTKTDAWAMYAIACFYQYGNAGFVLDKKRAGRWFTESIPLLEKAAQKNVIATLFRLAALHEYGWGLPKNALKAKSWCISAAQQGFARAQNALGWLYENDQGVEDEKLTESERQIKAVEWYQKAAGQEFPIAQFRLGECHEQGLLGIKADWDAAVVWYEEAARQGFDPEKFYQRGLALKEAPHAEHFLKWAADQGHASAQVDLGYFYNKSGNYQKAFAYFQLAASENHPAAFNNLASMYRLGDFVVKDYKEAMVQYKKVADGYDCPNGGRCEIGYGPAQYLIGWLYYQGGYGLPSNPPDYKQAAIYWEKAASHAHDKQADAHYKLGLLYRDHYNALILNEAKEYDGPERPQRAKGLARAAFYLRQAAKQNHAEAIQLLGKLDPDSSDADKIEHEAFYHKVMWTSEDAIYDLFYIHHTMTEFKKNTNAIYLKFFLKDPLHDHATKRRMLKKFALRYNFERLLPPGEAWMKYELSRYLFEIAEESIDPQEKQKFLHPDMLDPIQLQALRARSESMLYAVLAHTRKALEVLCLTLDNGLESNVLQQIIVWVRNFHELNLSGLDRPMPVVEQVRFFLEHYRVILSAAKALTPEIRACAQAIADAQDKVVENLNEAFFKEHIDEIRKNKFIFFKRMLTLRIASKWSAGMALYSGDIKHYHKLAEGVEAGLGIVKGILQCIPFVGGLGEIIHSSANLFHVIHHYGLLTELIIGGVEILHLMVEGYEFSEHYISHHGSKGLIHLYANLGIAAAEQIESFCNALCARFEEQIKAFQDGSESDLATFAEDMAQFALNFLMVVQLSDADRENLPELLIRWCSNQSLIGKGKVLKSIAGPKKEKITSGDLLTRTPLVCHYHEAKQGESKDEKPMVSVCLGLPERFVKTNKPGVKNQKTPEALDEKYGMAKASQREVAHFQMQLRTHQAQQQHGEVKPTEPVNALMASTASVLDRLDCRFHPKILEQYAGHRGGFHSALVYEPPLAVRVKQLEAKAIRSEGIINRLQETVNTLNERDAKREEKILGLARQLEAKFGPETKESSSPASNSASFSQQASGSVSSSTGGQVGISSRGILGRLGERVEAEAKTQTIPTTTPNHGRSVSAVPAASLMGSVSASPAQPRSTRYDGPVFPEMSFTWLPYYSSNQ